MNQVPNASFAVKVKVRRWSKAVRIGLADCPYCHRSDVCISRPKSLLEEVAILALLRPGACSDKSKNFGGSKTHRAAGSKMLHGGSKRAKAGEIVNRSIILNHFLLQDTHQRPIDLGVSSSYLRDELEGHRGACCRTSSLPPIAFFRSGFALHPADCVRLPQLLAEAELALVLRAPELFHAPGDHIEEESVIDDDMYALRALRTSIRDFFEEAAQSVVVS